MNKFETMFFTDAYEKHMQCFNNFDEVTQYKNRIIKKIMEKYVD